MIRIRCDATRGIHACSLWLDWTGQHPGDHRAHPNHDLSRPVLCTWPNLGVRSAGVPVHVPTGGASGRSTPPAPSGSGTAGTTPAIGPGAAAPHGGAAAPARAPLPGTTTPKPAPHPQATPPRSSQPQAAPQPPPAAVAPRKPRWYEYEVTEWDLLPDA